MHIFRWYVYQHSFSILEQIHVPSTLHPLTLLWNHATRRWFQSSNIVWCERRTCQESSQLEDCDVETSVHIGRIGFHPANDERRQASYIWSAVYWNQVWFILSRISRSEPWVVVCRNTHGPTILCTVRPLLVLVLIQVAAFGPARDTWHYQNPHYQRQTISTLVSCE